MTLASLLLALIFSALSNLHAYWVLGGDWGWEEALPTDQEGNKVLQPGKAITAIVSLGLLVFCLFYFNIFFPLVDPPHWIANILIWLVPVIFTLRVIGDFKYVGIFKKIKNTEFGKRDTRYYVPLCFVIAALSLYVSLVN